MAQGGVEKTCGEDVKNKDLWQQFLDEAERLGGKDKITFQFSKSHDYKDFLTEKLREKQGEAKRQPGKEEGKQEKR